MTTNVGMKELIRTVNDLQNLSSNIGQKIGWQLPQIVVVGGQSAGKSSVLESFVGRDFLPRGKGIVTRRPLILQLQHASIKEPYATFEHAKDDKGVPKVFTDFDAVRQEIEDDTDRVTGENKGLSRVPISLKVFSADVLDLTLVDLPGLTKVHVGDQPENIEKLIEDMILEYITEDNSIILAVTPANSDLANSDALKLARKVDPGGLRTIGVITKLDLMDRGTNAREIFLGKSIPLKRGYVGVVNRAQADIDNCMGIKDAISQEDEWFRNSPYTDLMDRMGSRVLQQILNEQLGRHIKEKLPSISTDLKRTLQKTENELIKHGYYDQTNENQTKSKQFKILTAKFAKDVEDKLQGKSLDVSGEGVSGGTAIGHMFYDKIYSMVKKLSEIEYDEKKMLIISANLSGYRHQNRLYPDDLAMERAIRDLTDQYKECLKNCVDMIKEIVEQTVDKSACSVLNGYPHLIKAVMDQMNSKISGNQDETKNLIMSFIEAHKSFMNYNHPHFIAAKNGLTPKRTFSKPKPSNLPRNQEEQMTESIFSPTRPTEENSFFTENSELELYKGSLSLNQMNKSKDVFVILTTKKLKIFRDEKDMANKKELKGFENGISLEGCIVNSVKHLKKNGRKFMITRSDGKMLPNLYKHLELSCSGMEEDLMGAFQEMGILNDVDGSNSNISVHSAKYEKSPFDDETAMTDAMNLSAKDQYIELVKKYMEILNIAIQDTTPKYIIMVLVQKTIEYARFELSADLEDETTTKKIEDYLETDSDVKRRINELVRIKTVTKEAVAKISDPELFRTTKLNGEACDRSEVTSQAGFEDDVAFQGDFDNKSENGDEPEDENEEASA